MIVEIVLIILLLFFILICGYEVYLGKKLLPDLKERYEADLKAELKEADEALKAALVERGNLEKTIERMKINAEAMTDVMIKKKQINFRGILIFRGSIYDLKESQVKAALTYKEPVEEKEEVKEEGAKKVSENKPEDK